MSLDVAVSPTGKWADADQGAGLALEDDGYYWFLYPFFESLWSRTGQMIDLYGCAIFAGDALTALLASLDAAAAEVPKQPEGWLVRVGGGEDAPLFDRVSKRQLWDLLARLRALAWHALAAGQHLVFFGD